MKDKQNKEGWVSEIPSLNYDIIKADITKAYNEGKDIPLERFANMTINEFIELYDETIKDGCGQEPCKECGEIEYNNNHHDSCLEYKDHLKEDGYRRVTLAFNGKQPMVKWVLKIPQGIEGNYVLMSYNGETEAFALIEDEDIPTMDFYFREDENEEYTEEEYARMRKEKDDPNFLWNLHRFRKHCREQEMNDSCRYYTEWLNTQLIITK